MVQEPTHDEATTGIGSARWQVGAISASTAELGGYLDRVARLPFVRRIADSTLDLLQLEGGDRVLDVGCGTGVLLPRLAAAVGPGGHVTGVDHAAEFVATARQRASSQGLESIVEVQEGDAYHLPCGDEEFHAAHCERLLMHLEDPAAALREMCRVVMPGGVVVVVEPD